jgi:nitrite reductase/ring-hydroxylating ferredoxin subunit
LLTGAAQRRRLSGREASLSEFVAVARVGEIGDGEGRSFEVNGVTVGVFNCRGRYFAISDTCTHAFALLHEGSVDRVRCAVTCPLHGAEFDLATGAVLAPPAPEPVAVYPVRVSGDLIEVSLPPDHR